MDSSSPLFALSDRGARAKPGMGFREFGEQRLHRLVVVEAVEGDCDEVVGDVRSNVCDDEVSNLGGFLALAEDCEQVNSNSSDVTNNE